MSSEQNPKFLAKCIHFLENLLLSPRLLVPWSPSQSRTIYYETLQQPYTSHTFFRLPITT